MPDIYTLFDKTSCKIHFVIHNIALLPSSFIVLCNLYSHFYPLGFIIDSVNITKIKEGEIWGIG